MRLNVCVTSTFILVSLLLPSRAKSEVVFDNITAATEYNAGFLGAIVAPGYQLGSIVNLSGTLREVTKIDIVLYEFGGSAGDLTFRVNFWDPVGLPGNLLWTSPTQHASLLNRTPTVFSVDVPGIHVPDTFGWTIEDLTNIHSAGLYGSGPVTAGSALNYTLLTPPSHWQLGTFLPNQYLPYGMRLLATPEPATDMLVVVAAAALLISRPSRRSTRVIA
jgi:hypothetical protein